jgi:glyoxylase-like metal-dependent hydrolase (beta-lactamase superfamily II)
LKTHRELIPGVHRIELPLPFELEAINLYLVRLDDGYLLIDCGMDTPQSFAALEAGIQERGIAWSGIRIIVLTHMHPDHIGLSRRVRALSGATVLMHETEAEHLDSLEDESRHLPYLHAAYTRGGVPFEMQSRMDRHFAFLRASLHDVTPDRFLRDGEQIASAIGPLEVVCTPGHSPGHICLYSAECKVLFAGDHILNKITPNISWHPGSDALGDYLESLERVGVLDIEHIYPAHGEPFSGHREWIRATAAHHARRCDEIAAAVADGATTAHEIVGRLWTRPLEPIHHHFAVFEVLAHLEYMQRQGRL